VRFPPPDLFSREEVSFLQDVLATGALLEDEHFPLALKILHSFISEVRLQPGEWLILNGLPRHRGQAQSITGHVRVATVVELSCPPEVVIQRIHSNAGGDRAGRLDDHLPLVHRKLEIYHSRTRPLIDFYKDLGIPVIHLNVGLTTTAAELATTLEASLYRLLGEPGNIGQTPQTSLASLMNKEPLGN
jgi:adenylate kinase family enzyme